MSRMDNGNAICIPLFQLWADRASNIVRHGKQSRSPVLVRVASVRIFSIRVASVRIFPVGVFSVHLFPVRVVSVHVCSLRVISVTWPWGPVLMAAVEENPCVGFAYCCDEGAYGISGKF
jgi:hypothetical protein